MTPMFAKFGTSVIFHKCNGVTCEVTSRKLNCSGVVQKFDLKLPNPKRIRGLIYFDWLPIIGTLYTLKGLKK